MENHQLFGIRVYVIFCENYLHFLYTLHQIVDFLRQSKAIYQWHNTVHDNNHSHAHTLIVSFDLISLIQHLLGLFGCAYLLIFHLMSLGQFHLPNLLKDLQEEKVHKFKLQRKKNLISKRTVGRNLVLLSTNGMYNQKKQKSDKNMCLQMVKIHYSLVLIKCDRVNSSHHQPAAKGIRFVWSIRFLLM